MTPWTLARQASLSFTISWSLLKLMSIQSVMSSNHLVLWHPHLLLPSIFPGIGVLSNESVLHIRWPKYWSFSFSISPYNEYSGLISFRIDWFDLLLSKGLSRSSLSSQFESTNSSALCLLYCPALTSIHDYWKDHSLDCMDLSIFRMSAKWCLCFLTMVCHSFLAKKQLSFYFMAAVTIQSDFRAQEEELCYCFHLFLFCLPWSDGTGCHDLSFLILSFKLSFSLASFTLIKRLFSSSSLSAFRVVSSTYLRLLVFLPAVLIPACNSSSLAFHMICSAYKLNKQGDNKQPCHTPF